MLVDLCYILLQSNLVNMKPVNMTPLITTRYEIPSHMVDIVENIVDPCRGLPLSLKVVGGTIYGFKRLCI
jgi:hypothetical protein